MSIKRHLQECRTNLQECDPAHLPVSTCKHPLSFVVSSDHEPFGSSEIQILVARNKEKNGEKHRVSWLRLFIVSAGHTWHAQILKSL